LQSWAPLESGTEEEIDRFIAGPGKGLVGVQQFEGLAD
jgi:hypothetical protein